MIKLQAPALGSVVIPAHNEELVIASTLTALKSLIPDDIEVIVVSNGSTDRTAIIARAISGIRVLEISERSKTAALNAGDSVAIGWPRLYLDADIIINPETVRAVLTRLSGPSILAARPSFRYLTEGCNPLVRAYYRTRQRIPATSEHLWGAGVYGLNEMGHRRLGYFPPVTADDLYVDQLFTQSERAIIASEPVGVRCPRSAIALLATLQRVYRGRAELARVKPPQAVGGIWPLFKTMRGFRSTVDGLVYVGFVLGGRMGGRFQSGIWQRDDTSRIVVGPKANRRESAAPGSRS
jgi:glycosyltransferase involved in cell wall biosynthesis